MSAHEIEIQVQVENSKGLLEFLGAQAKFVGERRQVDEYFVPAHKNFLAVAPIEEWLRLRTAEGGSSMNYKKWYFDEQQNGTYADEYETPVADIAMARRILLALDMKPIIKVDKLRKTWTYEDYEICIDIVEGLGEFVEVEYKGSRAVVDNELIRQEMIQFLKELGCGQLILNHTGYPALLLGRKEKQEII
jgi:adenylate cyclase class 2